MYINIKKATYAGLTILTLLNSSNAYGMESEADRSQKLIIKVANELKQNKKQRKINLTNAEECWEKVQKVQEKVVKAKNRDEALRAQKAYIKLFDQMVVEQNKTMEATIKAAREAEKMQKIQGAKHEAVFEEKEVKRKNFFD